MKVSNAVSLISLLLCAETDGFVVPNGKLVHSSSRCVDYGIENSVSSELSATTTTTTTTTADVDTDDFYSDAFQETTTLQYAALQTGSIVTVKAGSPSASRKVWKKRRRSDSPVLIPCSVLGIDREDHVRWNLWWLLQKYGRTLEDEYGGGKGGTDGVAIKVKLAAVFWEREFGGSLQDHAIALGYKGIGPLLLSMFKSDDSSSVSLEEDIASPHARNSNNNHNNISIIKTESNLILHAPTLPVKRARAGASTASLVQTRSDTIDGTDLHHTGLARPSSPDEPPYPLSAALRLSNPNALSRVQEGEVVPAYVFQFDPTGDNGQPLLVLSLDPPRGVGGSGGRRSFEAQSERRRNKASRSAESKKTKVMFEDLKKGDGPFKGTVLSVNGRARSAFVDIGAGRKRGRTKGGGVERILGMLRFEDIVSNGESEDDEEERFEEEEETIEDLSDLFEIGEDGVSLLSVNSETGEREFVGSIEGDVEDEDDEDDEDDDMFVGMSAEERLMAISELLNDDVEPAVEEKEIKRDAHANEINVGDEIDVFVLTVSSQSRRFKLTTSKPAATDKYKQVKYKNVVDKRLSKLAAHGGEGALATMEELKGTECLGVVKATSKTGNWFYVEHLMENKIGSSIPKVGVAHPVDEENVDDSLVPGSRVRVRLEGIDETRGQLAMTLLGKE